MEFIVHLFQRAVFNPVTLLDTPHEQKNWLVSVASQMGFLGQVQYNHLISSAN